MKKLSKIPGTLPAAANSRLIAAAPELLESASRAFVKLCAYQGVCSGDTELAKIILLLGAAIAKATGGAQ